MSLLKARCVQKRAFSVTHSLKKNVGLIGLGNMGARMAPHLIKGGHTLFVFDVNATAMEDVKKKCGAIPCTSPAEVARNVDALITMLPAAQHVAEVYEGKGDVFKNAKKGSIYIDSSTIDPETIRNLSKIAADKYGVAMLDAPVSGGVGGAEAGTLTFMVGADSPAHFTSASEILQPMAKNIVHCGSVGAGQVTKICNNLALAIEMIGISEAMNLGVRQGMDATKLATIFNNSTARCWSSDTYNPYPGIIPTAPASRGYSGGFGAKLMLKDLGIALQAAKSCNAAIPLGEMSQQLYKQMAESEFGDHDFSGIIELLQKYSSTSSK